MDLANSLQSKATYKFTIKNTHTLDYFYRNSLEGRIEKGVYALSKNFPISSDWSITENVSNTDYRDLYFTTKSVDNEVTVQTIWNYMKDKGDIFGVDLGLVQAEVVSKNEIPDLDEWWKDMYDELPEIFKGGYKNIKFILIALIVLYLISVADDILDIFNEIFD